MWLPSLNGYLGKLQGSPPPRSIIFFLVCTIGHRAGQSQSHVKYCFILIKYESTAF